jgi:hypothetical protein
MSAAVALDSGLYRYSEGTSPLDRTRGEDRPGRLSRAQVAVLSSSIVLAVLVACYGFAGSYATVSDLAGSRGVPLAMWVPAGIDGGLVALVVLDLVLVWVGHPVGWLRQIVRLLSVGTVAANAAGGWPDLVAVCLHTAAPAMVLAMVEAGRSVLLRRMGQERGTARDGIPLARWTLAPWRTWLLWRRMVLWQITNYQQALEIELEVNRINVLLKSRYGWKWRRYAPADLTWILRTGVRLDEVSDRVRALVDPGAAPSASASDTGLIEAVGAEASPDRLAEARQLNVEHWKATGKPISGEGLRMRLNIGAEASRELARTLRAAEREAICAGTPRGVP